MRGAERLSFCTLMFHHLLEDKWQGCDCCTAVALRGGKARGEEGQPVCLESHSYTQSRNATTARSG